MRPERKPTLCSWRQSMAPHNLSRDKTATDQLYLTCTNESLSTGDCPDDLYKKVIIWGVATCGASSSGFLTHSTLSARAGSSTVSKAWLPYTWELNAAPPRMSRAAALFAQLSKRNSLFTNHGLQLDSAVHFLWLALWTNRLPVTLCLVPICHSALFFSGHNFQVSLFCLTGVGLGALLNRQSWRGTIWNNYFMKLL